MIKVILWDIDGTLLNFEKAEGYALKKCFEIFDMGICTDEMRGQYSNINTGYWERLERNEITKQEVLVGRFREFFKLQGLDVEKAEPFNEEYQLRLGDSIFFNDDGERIVRIFKEKGLLQYAVTNGTLAAQRRKLKESGLDRLLDGAFISDEIGIEKPNIGFFEPVFKTLSKTGSYEKNEIMIVGDSLTSDIQGGNNAGIICCRYNPKQDKNTKGLRIDYDISRLDELLHIV